jgi:membrane-bound serine protease (ClpP class)
MLYQILFIVLGLFPLFSWADPYRVTEISHLEISSAISPATYDYLKFHFKKVPAGSLILIKMNTPGGLITTTKDIITLISAQDKPVVVWVSPEGASAASAGAIIAASAHFILMSPGTNMGAATPVGLGEDIKEGDGRSKMLSDLKAVVRSLSYSRNRPAAPFEEMIETAKSFTAHEALKAKFIDGIIDADHTLKDILDHKSFTLLGKVRELEIDSTALSKTYEPTIGQSILNVLANPSTAYLLFLIGVALIYFEFQAPGGFIAGGVGISFLVMAAIAFQVLPLDWGAFALIFIGAVLLILEIYVTSYGLLAISGVVSFVAGSLFLFHDEAGYISVNYKMLLSTLLGVSFAILVIVWFYFKDKRNQKIPSSFFVPIGSLGKVMKIDGPLFIVKVKGEIWRGTSTETLAIDDDVEITAVDSEKLIIEIKKTHKE